MDLGLFIVFIIGFCLGGLVGIDCPRQNTNAPPLTRPTRSTGELVLEQCLDIKDLKEQVINIFMRTCYKDNFKHQVHTLFEEEN